MGSTAGWEAGAVDQATCVPLLVARLLSRWPSTGLLPPEPWASGGHSATVSSVGGPPALFHKPVSRDLSGKLYLLPAGTLMDGTEGRMWLALSLRPTSGCVPQGSPWG